MPADRIDQAVRRLSPEPVVCWCNGQSLESRYSSSTTSAGAFGGRAAGVAVLHHQGSCTKQATSHRRPAAFHRPARPRMLFLGLPCWDAQNRII